MAAMPREPEAFAEQVIVMLRRAHPELEVDLIGPREALIDGRHLDLENLYRLVAHDPERGSEIVEQYIDHLFASEAMRLEALPFDVARTMIMPRIHHEAIFDRLSKELVAHSPYVNGTHVLYVIDMPNMTVSITTEQVIKWGIDADELDSIARSNLERYKPELDMQLLESDEGGKAILFAEQDGYDAARLLLSSLHARLAPELGGDFYVATPARDMFLALSTDPAMFLERVQDRVDRDFRRLPYPITADMFFVTRDGVAGTRAA